MRLPGLAVGFAPWVLFLVMPHRQIERALTCAALVAVVVAVLATRWTRGRSGLKLLDVAAMPTFAVVAVLSAAGPAQEWLRAYSSGVILLVLSGVMFGSLPWIPFTEQYAHEALPNAYWSSPHLHRLNVRLSGAWAVCTLAVAVSVVVAQYLSDPNPTATDQYVTLSLSWLLPVLLISVVVRYTATVTEFGTPRPHRNGVPL